jgi:hypothetical protein
MKWGGQLAAAGTRAQSSAPPPPNAAGEEMGLLKETTSGRYGLKGLGTTSS